ncbi:hypothetical protein BGZ54_010089 [Gamsiella multidivaricata]|nr:hypothetical protein BGZ54_010089 [Gamsiella multidivaricata]
MLQHDADAAELKTDLGTAKYTLAETEAHTTHAAYQLRRKAVQLQYDLAPAIEKLTQARFREEGLSKSLSQAEERVTSATRDRDPKVEEYNVLITAYDELWRRSEIQQETISNLQNESGHRIRLCDETKSQPSNRHAKNISSLSGQLRTTKSQLAMAEKEI